MAIASIKEGVDYYKIIVIIFLLLSEFFGLPNKYWEEMDEVIDQIFNAKPNVPNLS